MTGNAVTGNPVRGERLASDRGSAPSRVPRPWRALAALADVLAAVVLGVLAWWCWQRGVIVVVSDGVALSRIDGSWAATAVGAATLTGILLLDAGRQALLAIQATPAPAPGRDPGSG